MGFGPRNCARFSAGKMSAPGLCRSKESPQEGRQNGASAEISREPESEKRAARNRVGLPQRNRERLLITNFRGAWGCPVATRCNWHKRFEIMVSAAGFELEAFSERLSPLPKSRA